MTRLENINWYGHFNTITGYGIVNIKLPMALQENGVDVSYGWERYDEKFPEWQYLDEKQKAFISKPFVKHRVGIIKALPPEFIFNISDIRIGYTMVENTMMNQEWVDCCNTMDAMLVPSEFLVDIFKSCGVKVPVYAVRQGVDSEQYPFFDRSERKRDTFIFATSGFMDDRKNWKDLISAFSSEFDQEEPVELWFKNSNGDWGYFDILDDRIKIIKTRYTFEEMNKLYQMMDCFVCPSHAEGSGLTPREAMATGLPTILTNWSGLSEIASPDISFPLTPVAIDYPDFRSEEQPGFQARIEVRELMYYMRYVYEHRTESLLKGKKASDFIHKEYNWNECAKVLASQVEKIVEEYDSK
jgi:glycosyltransferase involved in cell wall biosynthesis